MNVWKLTAANNLVKFTEDVRPQEGKLRVRVTKIFFTAEDAAIFRGQKRVRYPFIPGRFAVGLVSDENGSAMFSKGTRVLLHSYLPAEAGGNEKKTFTEDDFRILGRDVDGFLRDFVYVPEEDMTPLPDSVNDDKSLLIQYVALAQATVDALDVQRGEHIAVVGGNILGLFIARLLIYQQAAPILIDSRKERLDFARSRGVYYTCPDDETLLGMVGTVTGGRLADGAVFVSSASVNNAALPLLLCASGKHVAYCGQESNISLPAGDILKKHLTVHGICDGTDYIKSAINLLANKAIDTSAFRFVTVGADSTAELLKDLADRTDRPVDEINVVSLV